MRDCEIRAAAIAKLLDLLESEVDLALEERDELFQAVDDLKKSSGFDGVLLDMYGNKLPDQKNKTRLTMINKANVLVNYIFMLNALRSKLEESYPAPAFDKLPF